MEKKHEKFILVSRSCFTALAVITLTACAGGTLDEKEDNHEHTEKVNLTRTDAVREKNYSLEEMPVPLEEIVLSDTMAQAGDKTVRILLVMTDGEYTTEEYEAYAGGIYPENFRGNYELRTLTEQGEQIDSLALTDESGGHEFNFGGEFDLALEDYNRDGCPDFTLGTWGSSSMGVYYLYTVTEDGRIEQAYPKGIADTGFAFSKGLERTENPGFAVSVYNQADGDSSRIVYEWKEDQSDLHGSYVPVEQTQGNLTKTEETSEKVKESSLVAALAGKWRLASEKTEENLKEYDHNLQNMWGTGIHYGNEMEIGPDGSFQFYIAVNYGGEGTVEEENGHLAADTEPYAPEGIGGSPAQFEIVPVTGDGIQYLTMECLGETLYWERLPEEETLSKEDTPLKENTPPGTAAGNGETLPAAYGKALWDVYRKGILPDGHQLEYTGTELAERNYFAICDVDGDGRKELLVRWSNPVSVAGMAEYVLDSDGGQCYTELSEYPSLCYYDNGSVEADWSHNQGKAGRIWPKHFYRYNQEKDIYESYGSMDAWDKSLEKEGFPDEIDADGDGLVYYLMPADWSVDYWSVDYWNGGYEKKATVDGSDYEAWRAECVGDARMIQPEYQKLTPENMEALGFMESE